jgi:hypothetical protein
MGCGRAYAFALLDRLEHNNSRLLAVQRVVFPLCNADTGVKLQAQKRE